MVNPSDSPSALPADRLLQIIHFQTEIAKTRMDLGLVVRRTADLAQLLTRAEGAVVEMVDGIDMVYRAATGIAEKNQGLRIPRDASISGLCVATGEALCCADSETDPRVNKGACRAVGLRSMVVVPLRHDSACEGVLKVVSSRPGAFDAADTRTLALISEVIAAAMAHADEHSAQVEEARTLYQRATRDTLTGLGNRAFFDDQLHQALAMARRKQEGFGLLLVDMDGLKSINDSHGHPAGDAAIRVLAARLRALTRESDVAARLGGDEFALILPSTGDRESAMRGAEKIGAGLEGPFVLDGREHAVGASLGLAFFPEDGDDADTLIARADQAMYAAKRARKAAR